MSPEYVCSSFHLVDVTFARVVEEPSVLERAIGGIEPGQRIERTYRAVWPHERFTRDDIDSAEVQRGFISMTVGPISRAYHRYDQVTLLLHKGVMRVDVPGQAHNPLFRGFAGDLVTAATWVATGLPKLFVPWDPA